MKRILFFAFFLSFSLSFNGFAQTINYSEPLPVDQTIKKGVLPNGMTYYIKSTDVVKDAASYYIIQNVGSVLENEDQQGLAHFLEHMAFNGTKNFPGKGILNTLQKHGAVFGKDINAYTSFDETVYNLNNIPTKDGLVDTCLTVLKDWSNYLLLTDEEIDAERGVIKEEWRTRQNGQMRLFQTSLPITFNKSKYSERLPIGLMSVVEGFKYKALRDFYHDWYRTDLQAIAIIGDVDVDDIEKKIIANFSEIPAVENPKPRYVVDIPENTGMLYSLGTDPEVSTASLSFGIRHKKSLDTETVGDLKRSLLESMATSLLTARISEQAQKPDASFLGAGVRYSSLSRTSDALSVGISPKPNMQKEAFKEVFTEVERAVRYGHIASEVERSITQIKTSYENKISKRDDASHGQIEWGIQNNFLSNSTITDVEKEYEIAKSIFNTITPEDVHNTIKRLFSKNNRYLNVTGVEGQDNLTEAQAKAILSEIENDNSIEPYTESLDGKTLVSDLDIKSGKITETKHNKEIDATTFILSNGVKVHYKFVNKEKDNVVLTGTSYGGTSLLSDDELPSADLMSSLLQMSGLGDFSATDLKKVLAGKTANVRVGLGEINENISGTSNTKDVETMLQMVHVYFVKPRFDEKAYKVLESNISNYIIRRSKDIGEQMRDSLTVAVYGKNNPKERIFNQDYVKDISFEKIKKVYNDRFANVSDFEFFIIGDVEEANLKPLLEKYIASIPTNKVKEAYKDNGAEWVSSKIDEDIYIAMEDPKASVNVVYKKEMPYSVANSIYTSALGDILQLRVLETVREAEGGAYSPRATANFSREPKSQVFVSFRFDCNPDMADKLVDIVNAELEKIANGTISDDDLSKTRTNFIKEREQAKDKNAYDMSVLTSYFRYNENINDPKNFENIVTKMTKKDIQKIAKEVLSAGKSYEVVFKPKQ
ncbi:M16 family metallopeptidase [Siansivirga zeaxanthinifaciens]|uniref:Peptidase M16 n=1 Tax=Siansivirga zeaxanthinifaciens CC-SAMT-1 TaxID=1454006 RepID=A0A0C5W9L1_9FLAO|nr:M16 family metallopeptidase [Siansivirga zeaxanthinifaciens]AJR03012.1 peptidase M16 [Siansivirga zeaxanthinifaciens CC-SAMT-1]